MYISHKKSESAKKIRVWNLTVYKPDQIQAVSVIPFKVSGHLNYKSDLLNAPKQCIKMWQNAPEQKRQY